VSCSALHQWLRAHYPPSLQTPLCLKIANDGVAGKHLNWSARAELALNGPGGRAGQCPPLRVNQTQRGHDMQRLHSATETPQPSSHFVGRGVVCKLRPAQGRSLVRYYGADAIVGTTRDNHAQPESRVPQSASVVAKPCSPANKRRRNQPRDYENCKLLCACAGQSECHCKQHTREHVSRCPSKC
jgi:hypothetical protein